MILDILMISLITCYIVDVTDIIDNLKRLIWKWVFDKKREYQDFRLKPLDCSLCLTFWICIIYLIATKNFNLNGILLVCIFSFLTTYISKLYRIVGILIDVLEDKIFKLITNL
jgi:hypothetical protein